MEIRALVHARLAKMGTRKLVDIGIGPFADAATLATQPQLTAPAADAHKYKRGTLLVVSGDMLGAGMLAARAAMVGGAGYVRVLAPHRTSQTPDSLVILKGVVSDAVADERINALLVGPGLGRDEAASTKLVDALAADIPCVLDADALHLLQPEMLKDRTAPLILTPHHGELVQLSQSFGIVTEQRIEMAQGLAKAAKAVVIAKGPDTVVAGADGALAIMPPAPSWLSIAGTGDVLAGLVASRLATGEEPVAAAITGATLQAEAARSAGVALTPEALIDQVPAAYTSLL